MGIFSGFLIASDFDATLTNDNGIIPEANRNAIRGFIKEGGCFTVCTGRTKQGFSAYSGDLINAPVLLANGSMAYDFSSDKMIFLDGIDKNVCVLLKSIMSVFPGLSIEMYSSDFMSFNINQDEQSRKHFSGQNITPVIISNPEQAHFPLTKIMLGAGDKSAEVQKYLSETNLGAVKYLPTYGSFVEILSADSDKGKGLKKLSSALGIKQECVFAVGDAYNDEAMLSAAHIGFAPANADAIALAAADVTVCSNNDGAIADVINYLKQHELRM